MSKTGLNFYNQEFVPLGSTDYMVMLAGYPELGPFVSTMEIPSRGIGRVRVEFMGKSRVFPGRRISSSNEVNMTFLLDRRTNTYQKLLAIQDSFSAPDTGNIVGRPFVIRAIHYDSTGVEAMVISFTECWLAEINSYELASSSENEIISVACTFCYAQTSYEFTGMGTIGGDVITNVLSRLTENPLRVGGTDRGGVVKALSNISATLTGSDPVAAITTMRQKLSELTGFSLNDLNGIRDAITTLRATTMNGITSKATALALNEISKRVPQSASMISTLKSIF